MTEKIELDPTQHEAIEHAVDKNFSIITGGAGTGKTTIIKNIYETLRAHPGAKVEMACFAGKAAARLREATGAPASTIHKMLNSNGVLFNRGTLRDVSIIIDEASMVSSDLMAEIIKRNPQRLILVGDPAQLPPVGKGQPFHDIINLSPNTVYHLTKCFRNTEAVFKAATAIREGRMPLANDKSASESWQFVHTPTPEQAQEIILDCVKNGHIDFSTDIILCPRNGDNPEQPCTVKGLNRAIVDIVNPRESEDDKFMVGDRIINTKNFSEFDVWNGTTGTIQSIDYAGCVFVELDIPTYEGETIIKFTKEMVKSLQLAYALSVHKSQGSQYRRVFFVCLNRDAFALLDRSLIYTAVTRTQQDCCVIGQSKAFEDGILSIKHKVTALQELAEMETA